MDKKLTRDCLDPWNALFVHSDGHVVPCCTTHAQLFKQKTLEDAPLEEILNGEAFVQYRKNMLSGELDHYCKSCGGRGWTDTETLKEKVKKYLSKHPENLDANGEIDLLKSSTTHLAQVELTSKCNLKCSYCLVSTPEYKGKLLGTEYLEEIAATLSRRKTNIVYPNGHGESTTAPGWVQFCETLSEGGQDLYIITNLNKVMNEEEAKALSKFHTIRISIDTVDPHLFSKLRRGGKLEPIIFNMQRIRYMAKMAGIEGPQFHWNCVLTNKNFDQIEEFVSFGNFMDVKKFHMCSLRKVPNSHGDGDLLHFLDCPKNQQIERIARLKKLMREYSRKGIPITYAGGVLIPRGGFHHFEPDDDNPVYKQVHFQMPEGSESVHLVSFDYFDLEQRGLFIHSGNKITLDLPANGALKLGFKCLIFDKGFYEASDQKFVISNGNDNELFSFLSRKGQRDADFENEFEVEINGPATFAVNTKDSKEFGWGAFVIDSWETVE